MSKHVTDYSVWRPLHLQICHDAEYRGRYIILFTAAGGAENPVGPEVGYSRSGVLLQVRI